MNTRLIELNDRMQRGDRHILVVDDDAQIRTLLRNLLEMEGYTVSEAASGEQMFSLLENEP